MRIWFCLSFLFLLRHSFAQTNCKDPGTLCGTIISDKHQPLEYATVSLSRKGDSLVINGGMTDSLGHFQLNHVPKGVYGLKIKALGLRDSLLPFFSYDDTTQGMDIGAVVLKSAGNYLKEVVIAYDRPVLERRLDRTIFNIPPDLALGNSAFDMLSKAPGVIVKPNDELTLLGKGDVRIFINDKPSSMSPAELNAFLKSLNASDILRIEVMTNPSSRYDAQGSSGIINIILKKGYDQGLKMNVVERYGQGYYGKNTTGAGFSYTRAKWNVFGNYSYENKQTFENNTMIKNFDFNQVSSRFDQQNRIVIANTAHTFRGGLDLDLTKNQNFGVIIQRMVYSENISQDNYSSVFNGMSILDSGFHTHGLSKNGRNDFSVNLNYTSKLDTLGSTLEVNLDHSDFELSSVSGYRTLFYLPSGALKDSSLIGSQIPTHVQIESGRLDYSGILSSKFKTEAGLKEILVMNTNRVDFTIPAGSLNWNQDLSSNSFNYTEQVSAAYVNLAGTWSRFSLQGGLRAEQSHIRANSETVSSLIKSDYLDLFPSLFANWTVVPDKQEASFSYSRRIERPYFRDLNPYVYFVDPYTYLQGNPYLLPQYTHSLELAYTLLHKYTLTVFYNNVSQAIEQIPTQNDSTRVTTMQIRNLDHSNQLGAALTLPFSVSKLLELNGNIYFYRKDIRSVIGSAVLHNSAYTSEVYLSAILHLPKKFLLELSGLYISPFINGIYQTESIYTVAGGIKRNFLKDRLSVKVSVDDAMYSYEVKNSIHFANQNTLINQRFDTRIAWLSLSFRLSRGHNAVDKNKQEGDLDEQKRVK